MKHLKSYLLKETLLDTNILINIPTAYRNAAFILMKYVFFSFSIIKLYVWFYLFLYMVLKLCLSLF